MRLSEERSSNNFLAILCSGKALSIALHRMLESKPKITMFCSKSFLFFLGTSFLVFQCVYAQKSSFVLALGKYLFVFLAVGGSLQQFFLRWQYFQFVLLFRRVCRSCLLHPLSMLVAPTLSHLIKWVKHHLKLA